jgi:hypothetical protein
MKKEKSVVAIIILISLLLGCDSSTNPEIEVFENKFCIDAYEKSLNLIRVTDSTQTWQLDFNFVYYLENSGGSLVSYFVTVNSLSTVFNGIKGKGWGYRPHNSNSLTFLKENEKDTISVYDSLTIYTGGTPVEFSFFIQGIYHNDSTFSTFDSLSLDGFFYTINDTIYP